jgi:hypothetical protein
MSNFKAYTILGLLLTGISAPAAMAEILVAPTRVVLENGERSSELVLVNKGSEPAAYRIDVLNRRMLVDGTMEDALEAREGESFAKDYIRYTPRRVILEPGSKQTVRISAQTSNLEVGEYRSHLRLQSAPLSAGRTLEAAQDSSQGDGISIQLIAIRSITIPIIARVGMLDADVGLETANVEDSGVEGESLLTVKLTRTGTRSTYGDIHIYKDGVAEPVYIARGIAVYTPNTERDVMLGLPDSVRGALRGETVRIAYVSSNLENPEAFAELRTVIN